MPFVKQRKPLVLGEDEIAQLRRLSRSRTAERRKVLRASILLDSYEGMGDQAIASKHGVNRNTVVLTVSKYLQFGFRAALEDLKRSGKPRRISDEARVWIQNIACQKPTDLGYSYELWTYQLLIKHIRDNCVSSGHAELQKLSRSKLHRILTQAEIRPHRVKYYVEKRDPDFESKMAQILYVYKEVEIINNGITQGKIKEPDIVTLSYDEKTGIQAIANTCDDKPPVPGKHPSVLRDYEYKRLGTVSLLAGIDLHTGNITEIISDTHKSNDFVNFLKELDATYNEKQTIRLVLDNHSAHISKETKRYLATRPQRFVFVFTPKHGSWLNMIESLFGKMARTVLREIRVSTKEELISRLHQYFKTLNEQPVVFRWKYKMAETEIV